MGVASCSRMRRWVKSGTNWRSKPGALEEMRCAVGARVRQTVRLENPTSEEITLKCTSSNTLNFRFVPAMVVLPPYGAGEVEVEYAPSSLDQMQEAHLVCRDPKMRISDWEFSIRGHGDPPSTMDDVIVYSVVKVRASSTFSFRNPFPEPIAVAVRMHQNEVMGADSPFTLLLKADVNKIVPFGTLQVPFIFAPQQIAEYTATVEIEAVEGLRWSYPIRGIAEALPRDDVIRIVTQTREAYQQTIEVPLVGMDPQQADLEVFTHELSIPAESRAIVERSIVVSALHGGRTVQHARPL